MTELLVPLGEIWVTRLGGDCFQPANPMQQENSAHSHLSLNRHCELPTHLLLRPQLSGGTLGSEAWLWGTGCSVDFLQPPLFWFFAAQGEVHTPQGPRRGTSARCGGWLPRGMPLTQFHYPHLLLLVLVLSCLVSAVHTPA